MVGTLQLTGSDKTLIEVGFCSVNAEKTWNLVQMLGFCPNLLDLAEFAAAAVAPLGWEDISLTGDYVWTPLDSLKGSFRPLRTGPSPFLRVA